jgi:hypothetical protein
VDSNRHAVYAFLHMPGLSDGLALLGGAILVLAATIPLLISEARARRELRERTRRKKVDKIAERLDCTLRAQSRQIQIRLAETGVQLNAEIVEKRG